MVGCCRAPWTSLSLDPRGDVQACCQNQWLRLGNIRDATLLEIWRGPELERLRESIDRNDFRLGCDQCRIPVESSVPESAYFHNFDHLTPLDGRDPPWPVQLELALSNTCNLRCVMCNGELSSSIRSQREHRPPLQSPYGESFFRELDQFLLRVTSVNFLGGEPLLARESLRVMDRLVELGVRPQCSVTTNGTIWNSRVAALVETLGMEVAVSVDGLTDDLLSSVRVGIDPAQLRENLHRLKAATTAGGGSLRLLFSLLRTNWAELVDVLMLADQLDVDLGLNYVEHPVQQSLVHGPLDELQHAVATLSKDAGVRRLQRNRGVWEVNLSRLDAVLVERRAAGSPVSLSARSRVAGAEAEGAFESLVLTDNNQIVVGVDSRGTAPAGMDLDQLLGASIWEVVGLVTGQLGRLVYSDHVAPSPSSGERLTFVFQRDDARFKMSAEMTDHTSESAEWRFCIERLPAGPSGAGRPAALAN
ncbi:MAG: SPASM domain-containing protein [Actinomycetes bacterium]